MEPIPLVDTARRAASVEQQSLLLKNHSIGSVAWSGLNVSVGKKGKEKEILQNVSGIVKKGEMLAIMGPSGAGKSTLLNKLADRLPSHSRHNGELYINGSLATPSRIRRISAYVEQQDALIGSLTVEETLHFALKLAISSSASRIDRTTRVENILYAFGLSRQADTFVGTPVLKGISGGQKRRLSVAAQLITSPSVLFLDEPTSGLDSAAAFEVVNFLRRVATDYKIIVIAAIHQPSTETFNNFDRLILLSQGRVAYNGPVGTVGPYFESRPHLMPSEVGHANLEAALPSEFANPAQLAIKIVNNEFSKGIQEPVIPEAVRIWRESPHAKESEKELTRAKAEAVADAGTDSAPDRLQGSASTSQIAMALLRRSFIKSYRDFIAYGVRLAMYIGLAILMGTVWLRLQPKQENIPAFINAIFFGASFMSFMAVAYIPSFLEDHATFQKERANGMYGATVFVVVTILISLLWLFTFSIAFSLVAYWLSNFRPGATAFLTWTFWLFLDLLAAESMVMLISSIVPVFVVALAGTSFINGLWMCAGGFLVRLPSLNPFYRYGLHYINYQAPVFEAMMLNEFTRRSYKCATDASGQCSCAYRSHLEPICMIDGSAVTQEYGFVDNDTGRLVARMFALIVAYQVAFWAVLTLRKR